MKLVSKIEKVVSNFYFGKRSKIKTTSELDKKIINDALPVYEQSLKKESASKQPNIWRIIMQSKLVKLTAAAVILLAVILGINFLGAPIDGASTAFAAAMDSIKQARTFSCTRIFEMTSDDIDINEGNILIKQQCMFKEPDIERNVTLPSNSRPNIGEITITDYSNHHELTIRMAEKTATLRDLSYNYSIDTKTGELKLTEPELDTSLRDKIIEMSMGTFNDMGYVELDGQSVLMLQSEKNGQVTTVWIDPKTNYPVQFEQKWPDHNPSFILYTSIQIDTELDDELFSLIPPKDYDLKIIDAYGWTDYQKKLVAKIKYLGVRCLFYANQNNNQLPSKVENLVTSGIITNEVLNKVLASPDDLNGLPILKYHQADINEDPSVEVMLYEIYEDESIDTQVVVGFLDTHCEIIPVQVLEQILKPWPHYKKKLVFNMSYLHWGCVQFAKENDGKLPQELEELTGGKFSEEKIHRLLASPGDQNGPAAIQYVAPRADAGTSTKLVLFEKYDEWPEDGIVACFADGHAEIIRDQNEFEQMIK